MQMRRMCAGLALMGLLSGGLPANNVAADGEPFFGFGVDGVIVDLSISGGHLISVHDVIDDFDGNLLVAGWYSNPDPANPTVPRSTGFLARYTLDGLLDPAFATAGVLRFETSLASQPESIAMLPDGSILVAGLFAFGPDLLRVSSNGSTSVPLSTGSGSFWATQELPDGRVLVGGSADTARRVLRVVRPAGDFDPSFDGSIVDLFDGSAVQTLGVVARIDGSIVAQLTDGTHCGLVEFDSNGILDRSFGINGAVIYPAGQPCKLGRLPGGEPVILSYQGLPTSAVQAATVNEVGNPTPMAWPFPTTIFASEGTGRVVGGIAANLSGSRIEARSSDGSVDTFFGVDGSVDFPGRLVGVRAMDTGDIVSWGTNQDYSGIVLQLLSSPSGPATQPPLLPTTKFVPVTPQRVLDSRSGLGVTAGIVPGGTTISVRLAGAAGIPSSGAVAVVLNVTATESASAGYVTVFPSGGRRPIVSNLNLERPGQTVANLVTVGVGGNGAVSLFTQSSTHLVADVAGYYVAAEFSTDGRFQSVPPQRLLDTRIGRGAPKGIVAPGGQIDLKITDVAPFPPTGVAAVVLNVTATEASGPGFITVWPGGAPRPLASNLNVQTGETRPNLVIVPVGPTGTVSLFSSAGAHLVADAAGWFTDTTEFEDSAGLFVPLPTPVRIIDTRMHQSAPLDIGAETDVRVGSTAVVPPFAADSVVINATVTEASSSGFVTLWPTHSVQPFVSNLNTSRVGQTIPNAAIVALGDEGMSAYTSSGGHLIVDLAGWYTIGSFPIRPF